MPLAYTNTFTTPPANRQRPGADIDKNFNDTATYVNARVPTSGTLANRPAFGSAGALYTATDVSGGTTYQDTGTSWIQVAASVTQQAPTNTPFVVAATLLAML